MSHERPTTFGRVWNWFRAVRTRETRETSCFWFVFVFAISGCHIAPLIVQQQHQVHLKHGSRDAKTTKDFTKAFKKGDRIRINTLHHVQECVHP